MMDVRVSATLMAADNLSKPLEEQEALYIEFPFVDKYERFKDEEFEDMLELLKIKDSNYILNNISLYIDEFYYDNSGYFNNMTAEQINDAVIILQEYDEEIFWAAIEHWTIDDLVEMNPQDFMLLPDIHTYEDLGYYYAEEVGCLNIPENIQTYFDYTKYGRDLYFDLDGHFTTHGWIEYLG